MNLTTRAEALSYYFDYDHSARGKNFFLSTTVGTLSLLMLGRLHVADLPAMLLSISFLLFTYLTFLFRYRPRVVAAVSTRKKSSAAIARMALPSRRSIIFEILTASAAALSLLFFPKPSVAEVTNNRIRKLLSAGRDSEAAATAREAIDAGIPLSSDVARAGGSVRVDSLNSMSRSADMLYPTGLLLVDVGNVARILVKSPILYIPPGKYLVSGTLPTEGFSMSGDGYDKCFFKFAFYESSGITAVLTYDAGRTNDVLIEGFYFSPANALRTRQAVAVFSVAPAPARVVAHGVAIVGLSQSLDRMIWVDSQFLDCTVKLVGDWFELSNVVFTECDFEFADEIPAYLRDEIQHGNLQHRTLKFRV